jgi:hypothetical protein
MKRPMLCLLATVPLLLAPGSTLAGWSSHPQVNTPVCTAADDQAVIGICADGSGGTLIAWYDDRDPGQPNDVYLQQLDAQGEAQWGTNGLRVYNATGTVSAAHLCSDDAGGAYLAIQDQVAGAYYTVVVQHVTALGAIPWGLSGKIATPGATSTMQTDVAIAPDGYGGVFLVWADFRSSAVSGSDLWAQRVNASGPSWGSIGVNINNRPGDQFAVTMAACPGGVVLAWQDERSLTTSAIDIYAQRLDGGGWRLWTFTGEPVCTASAHQREPAIASDGAGGAFISWLDYRNLAGTNTDVYSQHLDAGGVRQGLLNGTATCQEDGSVERVKIVSDGGSGAYVTWVDARDDGFYGSTLYAQHLGSGAQVLWNPAGVLICATDGAQGGSGYAVGTAGNADLLLVWPDQRSGEYDLYAQRLNSLTALQWAVEGLPVCQAADYQGPPEMVVETDGTCVATWSDRRLGSVTDVYAQRIDGQGMLCGPELSGAGDAPGETLSGYLLHDASPNPCNPVTTLRFELAVAHQVNLSLYDLRGRHVRTLVSEWRAAGVHEEAWNGQDDLGRPVSSGTYLYRLQVGPIVATKRLSLVR